MAILRKSNKESYTVILQKTIKDDRLSLKELGLLVRLLSLPDNWEFSENGLIGIFKQDGQASIRSGLKALEDLGYLSRTRVRDSSGRLGGVEWVVREEPYVDQPHLENPNLDNPHLGNPPQSNNKQSNTKESNTKKSSKDTRHKYGEYGNVLLSDEEMEKLKKEFPHDWQKRIDRLSEYMESKGVRYKNHLATIRAWARSDKKGSTQTEQPYDDILDDIF